MVRALAVHMRLAQRAVAIHCGLTDSLLEQIGTDVVRAAEGGKHTTHRQHLHGAQVDFLVTTQGSAQAFLVSGEAGRVQNDEVPLRVGTVAHLIALTLQEVERILRDGLNLQAVQFCILSYGSDSVLRNIHSRYAGGTCLGAGQSKATLVAEAIQHTAAAGQLSHFLVILQLVEVEAGFLAGGQVNHELDTAAAGHEGLRLFAHGHIGFLLNTLCHQHGGVIADNDAARVKQIAQDILDKPQTLVHGHRERLHHQHIGIAVDDETGQAIALAPHKAHHFLPRKPAFAQHGCLGNAAGKEIAVQVLLTTGEAARHNLRMRIIHGRSQVTVALILEQHHITRLGIPEHGTHLCAIYPIVTMKNTRLGRNDKTCHNARYHSAIDSRCQDFHAIFGLTQSHWRCYNAGSMNLRLSRKHIGLTVALSLSLLAGGIITLLPTTDPMLKEIAAYATQQGEFDAELDTQMQAIYNGANVDEANSHGYTPLMNAARAGNISAVDFLLVRGARLHHTSPNQLTAAGMAANDAVRNLLEACAIAEHHPDEKEKEQMLRNLRQAHIDPDDLNQALFDAVNSWHGDSVKLAAQVLALGGNANACNAQGRHILQNRHRNPGSMVLLLRQGSNPNAALDHQGSSHAVLNTIGRDTRFVQSLLAAGASVKGANALAKAAGKGDALLVQQFLERGADPDGMADNGKTVLEHAVQGIGHTAGKGADIPRCVSLLLSAGAKTEYTGKDGKARSPISPGGISIMPECIRLLVDAGANVNTLNSRGANYAQLAVYKEATTENLKLLKDIISAGANLEHVDTKGETFLFYALPSMCALPVTDPVDSIRTDAQDKLNDLFRIVQSAHPNPEARDRNGNTALHLAVIRRGTADDQVVEYLLRMGVDPSARNNFGRTALEAMLRNPCGPRSKYVARLLAQKGPLPTDPGLQLVLAAMSDDTATIRKVLETKPGQDIMAVALGCVQNAGAADLLLKAGAPAHPENIAYMVRHGNPDVVRIFIEHNRLKDLAPHWKSVRTEAMAKAFTDAGLMPGTPEEIANDRVLKHLLTLPHFNPNGVQMNLASRHDPEAMLPSMVRNGRNKMARMLLEHEVALNGYTTSPLALAKDEAMAEILLESGADLTWRSATGDTLLSHLKKRLKQMAQDYADSPTKEKLETFRAAFGVADMLENAGVSDIHPQKEEIKRALQEPNPVEEFSTVHFVTPEWSGPVRVSEKAMVMARASGNTDTANILSMGPDRIRFKWDRWEYGFVVRRADGKYHQKLDADRYHDLRHTPEKVPHVYTDFRNENDQHARLYLSPDYQYAVRGDTREGGQVLNIKRGYREASIRIKWDKGTETTLLRINGTLHILTPESARQALREYHPGIAYRELELVNREWQDTMRISTDFMVAARCGGSKDTAKIRHLSDNRISLKWDRWGEESFIRQEDGKFHRDNAKEIEAAKIRQQIRENSPHIEIKNLSFTGNGWQDTVALSFIHKIAVRRNGSKDAASIVRFDKNSITLKWDSYGEETFIRQQNGSYIISK